MPLIIYPAPTVKDEPAPQAFAEPNPKETEAKEVLVESAGSTPEDKPIKLQQHEVE